MLLRFKRPLIFWLEKRDPRTLLSWLWLWEQRCSKWLAYLTKWRKISKMGLVLLSFTKWLKLKAETLKLVYL